MLNTSVLWVKRTSPQQLQNSKQVLSESLLNAVQQDGSIFFSMYTFGEGMAFSWNTGAPHSQTLISGKTALNCVCFRQCYKK